MCDQRVDYANGLKLEDVFSDVHVIMTSSYFVKKRGEEIEEFYYPSKVRRG